MKTYITSRLVFPYHEPEFETCSANNRRPLEGIVSYKNWEARSNGQPGEVASVCVIPFYAGDDESEITLDDND